jgi:hypothetical protein
MKWFGESWQAPICAPEDEVGTPVGAACLLCEAPIAEGDQGVIMPYSGELVDGLVMARMVPEHLDCFLDSILPHGVDCPRCRGLERNVHAESCDYRTGKTDEGHCSCEKGKTMVKLLDSSMTLAEAQTIADEMGMTLDYVLTVLKRRRTRKNAHGREARSGHGPAV